MCYGVKDLPRKKKTVETVLDWMKDERHMDRNLDTVNVSVWLPRKILSALLKCILLFTLLAFSPVKNVIDVNVQSFEKCTINRDVLFTFAEICVKSFKISEILF